MGQDSRLFLKPAIPAAVFENIFHRPLPAASMFPSSRTFITG